ncbi:MAG TPA: glycosyltransferase, partial [Rhodopila sp.]
MLMQDVRPLPIRRSLAAGLSVVVPAFNEASGLDRFHQRLLRALDGLGTWEVVYVNDGSTDATMAVIET